MQAYSVDHGADVSISVDVENINRVSSSETVELMVDGAVIADNARIYHNTTITLGNKTWSNKHIETSITRQNTEIN